MTRHPSFSPSRPIRSSRCRLPALTGSSHAHLSRARTWAWLMVAVAAVGAVPGCQKPLLRPDEERSQFDRYDMIRERRAPPFIEDEFGNRRPNIRGRLEPKD
ncbi:MAG: hypothetical protein SFZ23_03925 [Planctomycetota bacterium]|nr:hypothetical protein [Planctomycetota bacterium]